MTTKKAPPQMEPAPSDPADAYALQALQRGEASPDMQRRALDWFINAAALTYEVSFSPDNPYLTAFAEGRRFAGLQTVKMLKLNPSKLQKA